MDVDIKPSILSDDIPDKSSLAVSACVARLKHSRYEDVWPEDVHAAFMEAVALYPPMGKRRLKYYRISANENEHSPNANRAKSFGRCQLIQSYILEKTGKNRSRKQVSSHLQRLKKIHRDNPAMHPLFSECTQPSSEHCSAPQGTSQDIFTDSSVTTRHLKSDPDISRNSEPENGAVSSATPPLSSGPRDPNALNLPIAIRDQSCLSSSTQESLSPVPQHCSALALYSSHNNYPPELQDALFFKDAAHESFRSSLASDPLASAFSTSVRHLTSKLPAQDRLADSGQTIHFSRTVHSLGFQPTHQLVSHDSRVDGVSCNFPTTSAQEAFHAQFLPFQLVPSEKRRPFSGLATDRAWQKFPELALDPQDGSLAELCLRYSPTLYQYNPTCPEVGVITPVFHNSPSETDVSRISGGTAYLLASPESVLESVPNGSTINFPRYTPEASESPQAASLVIRPTPIYPNSYNHFDVHSNIYSGSDSCTPIQSIPH